MAAPKRRRSIPHSGPTCRIQPHTPPCRIIQRHTPTRHSRLLLRDSFPTTIPSQARPCTPMRVRPSSLRAPILSQPRDSGIRFLARSPAAASLDTLLVMDTPHNFVVNSFLDNCWLALKPLNFTHEHACPVLPHQLPVEFFPILGTCQCAMTPGMKAPWSSTIVAGQSFGGYPSGWDQQ